jgi:hypothetical protein
MVASTATAAVTVPSPESLPRAASAAEQKSVNENTFQITVNNDKAFAKLISLGTEFKKMTSLSVAAVNGYVVVNQDSTNKAAILKTILGNALNGSGAKTMTFGKNVSVFKANAFSGTSVEKINFKSTLKLSLSSNAFKGYGKTKTYKIKLTFNVKAYSTEKEQTDLINKLVGRGFNKANITFKNFQ